MMTYSFRDGRRVSGVSAEIAGAELARICTVHNGLRPPDVVEAARPPEAPLHPIFEWDDPTAADAYRLQQARELIRAIAVAPADASTEPRLVYVHVSAVDGYQPVQAVVERPEWFMLARDALALKLVAAQRALNELRYAASNGAGRSERVAALDRIATGLDAAAQAVEELT